MTDIGGDDAEPGSSRRQAIVVSNVLDEYAWIREHYPDYRVTFQALCWFPDGFFDMLRIQAEDGEQRELYFTFRRPSRKRLGPALGDRQDSTHGPSVSR